MFSLYFKYWSWSQAPLSCCWKSSEITPSIRRDRVFWKPKTCNPTMAGGKYGISYICMDCLYALWIAYIPSSRKLRSLVSSSQPPQNLSLTCWKIPLFLSSPASNPYFTVHHSTSVSSSPTTMGELLTSATCPCMEPPERRPPTLTENAPPPDSLMKASKTIIKTKTFWFVKKKWGLQDIKFFTRFNSRICRQFNFFLLILYFPANARKILLSSLQFKLFSLPLFIMLYSIFFTLSPIKCSGVTIISILQHQNIFLRFHLRIFFTKNIFYL